MFFDPRQKVMDPRHPRIQAPRLPRLPTHPHYPRHPRCLADSLDAGALNPTSDYMYLHFAELGLNQFEANVFLHCFSPYKNQSINLHGKEGDC